MRNTEVQTIDSAELHRVQGGCKRGGGCQMQQQAMQQQQQVATMRPRTPPQVDVSVATGAQAAAQTQQVTTA